MHIAKYFSKIGMGAIIFYAVSSQLIFEFFSQEIIATFTTAAPVAKIITSIFFLVSTFVALEILNGAPMGVVRGLGLQKKGTLVVLVGYWGFGLPTSSILVFVYDWGPLGFWTGQVAANSFNFCGLWLMLFLADWQTSASSQNKQVTKQRNNLKLNPSITSIQDDFEKQK